MSRHPVLTWTLRALRAAQLAILFLFVGYFVCVQINAIFYLAGRNRPVVRGAVPPVALGSIAAAAADIIAGLVVEAVAALILFIVAAMLRGDPGAHPSVSAPTWFARAKGSSRGSHRATRSAPTRMVENTIYYETGPGPRLQDGFASATFSDDGGSVPVIAREE